MIMMRETFWKSCLRLPLTVGRTVRLLKPTSIEQLIENLTVWNDIHDVELNISLSLELPGTGNKRKHTNNDGSGRDSRRKIQVRNVQASSELGTQTWVRFRV